MSPPRLIFLKSPSPSAAEDKYTKYLLSNGGYEPRYIPPLTSHLLPSTVTCLRTHFTSGSFLSSYSGLILTSQRSVEALSLALSSSSSSASSSASTSIASASTPCPLFVVGPATGSAAAACCEANGFAVDVRGMESGNAAALATYILEYFNSTTFSPLGKGNDTERKPLLYLAGETHDLSFAATLRAGNVPVHELIVYATAERTGFGNELRAAIQSHPPGEELWLVACAPSGLAAMLKALDWLGVCPALDKEVNDQDANEIYEHDEKENGRRYDPQKRTGPINVAAIGPKTEQVARERFGFVVDATAETPTPEGVWRAIVSADEERSGGSLYD